MTVQELFHPPAIKEIEINILDLQTGVEEHIFIYNDMNWT